MSHITRPVVDAFQYLIEDHVNISNLLQELDSTTEETTASRHRLFALIDKGLSVHAELEEEILYPTLESLEETHEMTMESYEEHHVMKMLLEELNITDIESDDWIAKFSVLKENVEHHVSEEEEKLIPEATKILSQDELKTLADQIEDWLVHRGI